MKERERSWRVFRRRLKHQVQEIKSYHRLCNDEAFK